MNSFYDTPYICSLSGIRATEDEIDTVEADEDYPEGWIRVTVERKVVNPWWQRIQQCIEGELIQNIEASGLKKAKLGEAEMNEAVSFIQTQLDAKYAPALSTPKYEKWIIESEEIFISPPETDPELSAEYSKLRDLLGMESLAAGPQFQEPVPAAEVPKKEEAAPEPA